jgi:hypothetical protein
MHGYCCPTVSSIQKVRSSYWKKRTGLTSIPITSLLSVISGFRCYVDEIRSLLGHYAASNGNPLPTFRDNVSVPSSKGQEVKEKKEKNLGPMHCLVTSVKSYHSRLRNTPEERRSYFVTSLSALNKICQETHRYFNAN